MIDKTLKILHLEDLPSDAMLVKHALKKGKIECEILVVDTKDTFIKALQSFSPDLILADHSLPSLDYNQAWDIFQETGLKIPFILITGALPAQVAADTVKKGFDDYILKDRVKDLPLIIEKMLEKYAADN